MLNTAECGSDFVGISKASSRRGECLTRVAQLYGGGIWWVDVTTLFPVNAVTKLGFNHVYFDGIRSILVAN